MKRLVIVRHGTYNEDGDGRLDAGGIVQIRKLSEELKKFPLGSVALLTSTAPRASDSARIVGEVLGVTPQEHPVLWSGGDALFYVGPDEQWGPQRVLDLIQKHEEADTVILVAHLESTLYIPYAFGLRILGVNTFPKEASIGKGTAWLIDCVAKTCLHIP